MTNFLRMAHAISDLGYDVYIFKRFADGGRGDFIPQFSRIRTIFFVNRPTGRIYTCIYDCFYTDDKTFGFGAIEYKSAIKQLQYGYEGYGYWCQEDGTLDTSELEGFLNEILSDMEKVYAESTTGSSLFKAEDLTEQYIAQLGYELGFRYKYQIRPTAFSCKGLALGGAGYGYKISAQEYYAKMKRKNPNLKIAVVDPMEDWEDLKKIGDSSFFFLK